MFSTSRWRFTLLLIVLGPFLAYAPEREDQEAFQKELQNISRQFQKLKDSAAIASTPEGTSRFMRIWAGKMEDPTLGCTWLSRAKPDADVNVLRKQFERCQEYLGHLRLIRPYLVRLQNTNKCAGPALVLRAECMLPGMYSDAIEFNYSVATVECWLTCPGMMAYVDEKVPLYEGILRSYAVRFAEEKRRKEEEVRLLADRQRREKLRTSKDCAVAQKEIQICHRYAVYHSTVSSLGSEKSAGHVTGYVDPGYMRILDIALSTTYQTFRVSTLEYQKFSGKPFMGKLCEGWIRGANSAHPLTLDMNRRCGME